MYGASHTARPGEGIREVWALSPHFSHLSEVWESDLPSLALGFHEHDVVRLSSVALQRTGLLKERKKLTFIEHLL